MLLALLELLVAQAAAQVQAQRLATLVVLALLGKEMQEGQTVLAHQLTAEEVVAAQVGQVLLEVQRQQEMAVLDHLQALVDQP
jgi:hydrogenase maturation factor